MKPNPRDTLSAAAVAFADIIEERESEIAARTAERDDAREKLAVKDAEIERLMNTVVNCAKEMQLAASVTAIVGPTAEGEIAQLRTALRETREALAGITPPEGGDYWCPQCQEALDGSRVTYQERCDTCGSPVSVADGEEFEIARAVLARYADLAGEADHD